SHADARRRRGDERGAKESARLAATSSFAPFHSAPDMPWRRGAATIAGLATSRSTALLKTSSAALPAMPHRPTARRSSAFRSQRSRTQAALVTAEAMKRGGSHVRAPCQTGTAVLESRTAVYPASGTPSTPAPTAAPSPIAARGPARRPRNRAAVVESAPTPARRQLPLLR